MFKMSGGSFPSNPSYLEFRGLRLDGNGKALDGFFCAGSHHLRFIGNSISNTGGAGIASVTCDYLTADGNMVYHNGYIPATAGKTRKYYSWTSGISFNSNQWYDAYSGFHNVISNNIVAGEVDQSAKHSDGNGIILDLSNRSYDADSANTPPALVINNVVYGNGGRCMEAYLVTNFWLVNNTCYKNNLDRSLGKAGSITVNNARDGFVVNNIALAWNGDDRCYAEENKNRNIRYLGNICFGGSVASRGSDASQILYADPRFVNPPPFHPEGRVEYRNALAPALLGNGFELRPDSPALRHGIDPTLLPNLPENISKDLKNYVYRDINATPRRREDSFDSGAFESSVPH